MLAFPIKTCKKELIEIREKNKKESEEKKMREKTENKEMQKQKLEDAIRMHHGFMPDTYKSVQGKILIIFESIIKIITLLTCGILGEQICLLCSPNLRILVRSMVLSIPITSLRTKMIPGRTYWKQFQILWHCYTA